MQLLVSVMRPFVNSDDADICRGEKKKKYINRFQTFMLGGYLSVCVMKSVSYVFDFFTPNAEQLSIPCGVTRIFVGRDFLPHLHVC